MAYTKMRIRQLEREINKHKPLSAFPKTKLMRQCRESGVKIRKNKELQIGRVAYLKDEVDIFCIFHDPESGNAVFTSIVNLEFTGEGPIFDKIKKFQA